MGGLHYYLSRDCRNSPRPAVAVQVQTATGMPSAVAPSRE